MCAVAPSELVGVRGMMHCCRLELACSFGPAGVWTWLEFGLNWVGFCDFLLARSLFFCEGFEYRLIEFYLRELVSITFFL